MPGFSLYQKAHPSFSRWMTRGTQWLGAVMSVTAAASFHLRRSFGSKAYKVRISYAAKIPFKFVSCVLQRVDGADTNSQDALRVLDIVLRQQAASRLAFL